MCGMKNNYLYILDFYAGERVDAILRISIESIKLLLFEEKPY